MVRGFVAVFLLGGTVFADADALAAEANATEPGRRAAAFARIERFEATAAQRELALLHGLFDEDYHVVRAALRAAARVGPAARNILPALSYLQGHAVLVHRARLALGAPSAGLATDGDAVGKLHTLAARTRLAADAPDAPADAELAAMLKLGAYPRRMAAQALRRRARGRSVPALRALTRHEDPRRRRLAAQMVTESEALRRLLTDGDVFVRRTAAASLGRLRHRAAAAVPDLVKLLNSAERANDLATVRTVLQALWILGVPAHGAAPRIAELLEHADAAVRAAAAEALAQMRVADPKLLPALERALHDEQWQIVRSVLKCLRTMGPLAKSAAPAVSRLADAWPMLTGHVPPVLRSLGGAPPLHAAPAAGQQVGLAARLKTGDAVAAFSLGRIQGDIEDATLDALRDALLNDDAAATPLRRHAAQALARMAASPAAAPRVIARLTEGVRRGSPRVRYLVLRTLGDLAPRGARLPVDDIRAQLGHVEPKVRHAALGVFCAMPSMPSDVLPLILRLVDDDDPDVSRTAIYALGRLRGRAQGAVPRLVTLLSTWEDSGKASMAMTALKQIGPSAADTAIPAIVAAAREPHAPTGEAVRALAELGARGHEALATLVMDGKIYSRFALETIARKGLRPPNLRAAIDSALQSKDTFLRRIASEIPVSAAAGSPAPAAVFESLAQDPRYRQRTAVLARLAKDADAAAIAPFVNDARAAVRWGAWYTLAFMDQEKVPAALLKALRPKMVAALKDQDVGVRYGMIAVWLRHPPKTVTPDALYLLAADFSKSQRRPLLAMLKPLPSLDLAIRALRHADPIVRHGACYLIADYGEAAKRAVPELNALSKRDPKLRQACGWAFQQIGATTLWLRQKALALATYRFVRLVRPRGPELHEPLRELLSDSDKRVRIAAVHGLATLGAAAVEDLWKGTEDGDVGVRKAALQALAWTPDQAERLVPVLLKIDGRNSDRFVQDVLQRLGPPGGPALRKAAETAAAAGRARIMSLAPSVREGAVPLLRHGLVDADEQVRRAAAAAVGVLGAKGAELVPDLRRGLRDPSPDVRVQAMYALSRTGAAGHAAVPDLVRLLRIGSAGDRSSLRGVFARIGEPAVAPLLELFGARDKELRAAVHDCLAATGRHAVPGVIAVLGKAADEDTRMQAGEVLKRIGTPAIGPLMKSLSHESADVRRHAAWRIGQFGRNGFPAVPALTKLLRDRADEVASQAAWTLGQIGPGADTALPELERMLKNGEFPEIVRDSIRRIRGR